MTTYINIRVKALTRSKKMNKGRKNEPRTENSRDERDSVK
jgi:hypothetical protein